MSKKKRFISMVCLAIAFASVGLISACGEDNSVSSSGSSSGSSVQAPIEVECKVKFETNGGSLVDTQVVKKGEKATKPADPTKPEYNFVEWQLNGNTYNFDTAVMGDITLKAKWEKQEAARFTVTFVSEGETLESKEVIDGNKVFAPANQPERTGYFFGGWLLNGESYDFDTPVTQSITLTAQWINGYTVSFDVGEGTAIDSVLVKEGDKVAAPATQPTYAGHIFDGWLLNGESYDFDTPVTQSITLTAAWANAFNVTFEVGEGTAVEPVLVKEGSTLSAPVTTQSGYAVTDWLFEGASYDFDTPVTQNITLTAVWEAVGLSVDQIGIRINGWNKSSDTAWIEKQITTNNEAVITTKFQANATYNPALILNVCEKEYYQDLMDDGNTLLTFNLAVGGTNAEDISDLYVFGKALTSFPENNGVYTVSIAVQHFVSYYQTMYDLATLPTQAGQSSSLKAKFITWQSPANEWNATRNYQFTISDIALQSVTVSVDFASASHALIAVGETTTLVAETNAGEVVWSSSNEAVATVENGVVTALKSGETTITASCNGITASKNVYVEGDWLTANQMGIRINGWNMSSNATYLSVAENNGDMVLTTKFQANATYAPAIVLRNIRSKAYYEALKENGYLKLTFNLAVGGTNAADISDLYVFGKALTSFPVNNGVYAVTIDTNLFVTYYDTMYTIATSGSQVGQASSINAKFITWKSPANEWSATRDYVFTISDAAFRAEGFYAEQMGIRINGWNMSSDATYLSVASNNSATVITTKFQASDTYNAAIILKKLYSKEMYESWIANGKTKISFELTVGGENAADISDLYVFGHALTSFPNANGVYTVTFDVQVFVSYYDTMNTIATSGTQVGQASSINAKFITWKSAAGDYTSTRNYVFTISNTNMN